MIELSTQHKSSTFEFLQLRIFSRASSFKL